ncbi:manganese efflux pump [Clostridiaceae bacterium OttesenSCG-928-D20]|nr:manganese efflux pump [Clostridiaceae bacterium OttesenSCG-928-D20]
MNLFFIALLGIAASLDNLCVGIARSVGGKRISVKENLILSSISGLLSYIACYLAKYVSDIYTAPAIYIGGAVLALAGAWGIFDAVKASGSDNSGAEKSSLLQLILLGLALAINGAAAAFGAGLSGAAPLPLALSIALFSLIFIELGTKAGAFLSRFISEKSLGISGGLLLIILGLFSIIR